MKRLVFFKRILMLCIFVSFINGVAYAETYQVTINLEQNARLADAIQKAALDQANITSIKVTGDINTEDVSTLRTMVDNGKLRDIDLYNANYVNKTGFDFAECRYLKSIKLMSNMDSITQPMFAGCHDLSYIYIPKTVKYMGYGALSSPCKLTCDIEDLDSWCHIVFEGRCLPNDGFFLLVKGKEINDVNIPYGIDKINSFAFIGCLNLSSIVIPNSVKEIGEFAFSNCENLELISLPNSITKIKRYAFSGCEKLAAITLSNSITELGEGAFDYTGLTSITIPSSIREIPNYAFTNTKLTSVIIPDNVVKIGYNGFCRCYSLSSVSFSRHLKNIGAYAFKYCDLATLSIPSSVDSIGINAFCNCDNLMAVYAYASKPAVFKGEHTHAYYEDECHLSENCTLYVPRGSVEAYRLSNWGKYFSQIEEFDAETGIENVSKESHVTATERYDAKGQCLTTPTKGINIVRFNDGSARKVIVK